MSGPSHVTILIKAPNQMVEDQSVLCERHWTVKELKVHLSNVYPSKPHPEGQKLIYSGKLLSDGTILSDVLKTYDGHENNTIHLVCSTKDSAWASNVTSTASAKPNTSDVPEPVPTRSWPSNSGYDASVFASFPENVNNHARRRYPAPFPGPVNNVPYTYNYYNQDNMNRHFIWAQQVYMQYMTQYMQMSNGRYYVRPEANEDQPDTVAPVNQPPPPNVVAEEEPEEENRANRDWLEWIYIISRLLILSSVVYFYSSPLRFMLVMTVALILFSIDLERWRRRNNVNEPQEIPNSNDNSNAEDNSNEVNNIQERPHWLAIVWTFLSSFFLSLIPDQRDIP